MNYAQNLQEHLTSNHDDYIVKCIETGAGKNGSVFTKFEK